MDKLTPNPLPRTQAVSSSPTSTAGSTGSSTGLSNQAVGADNKINTPTLQNIQTIKQLTQVLQQQASVTLNVKSSQALTQAQQQLLSRVNPGSAELVLPQQSIPSKPSTTTTNQVYLVKLAHMQQTLTTVTSIPLKAGDKVDIQLNQQQLMIKPSLTTNKAAIAEQLRQLPQQQNTVSQLNNLVQKLQQLPSNIRQTLLSPSLNESLRALNQSNTNPAVPPVAANLKERIQLSGLFFENSLQSAPQKNSTTAHNTKQDLQVILGKLQQLLPNSQTERQASNPPSTVLHSALESLLTSVMSSQLPTSAQTNKADTQQLNQLLQLLGIKLPTAPNNGDPKTTAQQLALQLAQQLKEKLHTQLQQQAQGAHNKIRMNQLRSLAHEAISTDTSSARPALHIELPLRWGEQVLPLQLHIQEQEQEKQQHSDDSSSKEETKDDQKTLTKRWQVFLSLELPQHTHRQTKSHQQAHGETHNETQIEALHTQLTLVDQNVCVTLWAESHTLHQSIEQKLQYLRDSLIANGLEVDELECIKGRPPQSLLSDENELMASLTQDYHLVDINT